MVAGSIGTGATNTLELGSAASPGTISAVLQAEFQHFGTITVDAGANWTLTGNSMLVSGVTLTDLSGSKGVGVPLGNGGTLVDSGVITIGAGILAVQFGGTGASRLVLEAGYHFGGAVAGSTGTGATNTPELGSATGAGTISAALQTEFQNFGTIAVDAGADWALTGNSKLASGVTLTNLGTLINSGALGGSGSLVDAGTLVNSGSIGVGLTLAAAGSIGRGHSPDRGTPGERPDPAAWGARRC